MPKIYTLYHNNCPDGFGSALAAYLKFGDKSEYIGVKHQQDPPELEPGSEVYILDNIAKSLPLTTTKQPKKPSWEYAVPSST
jgi:hypothetical protein